jgi:hypothetical protein
MVTYSDPAVSTVVGMTSRIRRWARLNIIANVVFVGCWLLAAVWQGPHYSVAAHSISDMYADGAPAAAFLIIFFTLCGAVTVLFAFLSLWPALRGGGPWALIGSILVAVSIFGLGDLLTPFEREGCRLADPGCTSTAQLATAGGATDAFLSTAGVVALALAGFFLAAAMRRLPEWRSWSVGTMWASIGLLVLLVLDGIAGGGGLGGFAERLIALGGAAGLVVLALGVARRARTVAAVAVAQPVG